MGEKKECHEGGMLIVGLAFGAMIVFCIILVSGYCWQKSTPIGELEVGKIYEVNAIARDGQNYLVLLKADGSTKYYQIPEAQIPAGLEPGDELIGLLRPEPLRIIDRALVHGLVLLVVDPGVSGYFGGHGIQFDVRHYDVAPYGGDRHDGFGASVGKDAPGA